MKRIWFPYKGFVSVRVGFPTLVNFTFIFLRGDFAALRGVKVIVLLLNFDYDVQVR